MEFDQARRAGPAELRMRVISAFVLAPIALAAEIRGGLAFTLLVTIVAAIAFWEWTAMVGAVSMPVLRWVALILLTLGLLVLGLVRVEWAPSALAAPVVLFVAAGVFLPRLRWLSRGMAYVALPAAAFIVLRQAEPFGWAAILYVLIVVWATDIAAYFGGRTLGGPKLWPSISPKKTWSGAISGLVLAVLAGGVTVGLTGAGYVVTGMVLAAPLSIAAQAGDLFESAVKRRFGVKDLGTIIPGHGGVLDRVDGLFGAAALAWILAVTGVGGETLALPGSFIRVAGGSFLIRRITLLGATGSVGTSAADVIAAAPGRFEVHAVTAHSNSAKLADTARRLRARRAVVAEEASLRTLRDELFGSGISASAGLAAMEEAASEPVDMVLSAIVGAAGLRATAAAIRAGSDIALAKRSA